jgi:hypothetical protein
LSRFECAINLVYPELDQGGHKMRIKLALIVLTTILLLIAMTSIAIGHQRYAVIVSGNPHQKTYCERFWSVARAMYDILIDQFEYEHDHIFFLFYDTTSCYHSDDPRVDAIATKQNIRAVFEEELIQVDSAATLFCFFVGLGNATARNSLFETGNAFLQDYLMAALVDDLPDCFVEQTYVFTQPHSGGFCKTMSRQGTVIIASSKMNEGHNNDLSPFAGLFVEAFSQAANVDIDGDGRISIGEAYIYSAEGVEQWLGTRTAQYPQIDDNGDGLPSHRIGNTTGDGAIALNRYLE